eukprot:2171508-Ditylum_brightwellii.AAC.1
MEAKGQTCQRVAERAALDHFGHLMKESEEKKEAERKGEEVKAFNSKGKGRKHNKSSGKHNKNWSRKA